MGRTPIIVKQCWSEQETSRKTPELTTIVLWIASSILNIGHPLYCFQNSAGEGHFRIDSVLWLKFKGDVPETAFTLNAADVGSIALNFGNTNWIVTFEMDPCSPEYAQCLTKEPLVKIWQLLLKVLLCYCIFSLIKSMFLRLWMNGLL